MNSHNDALMDEMEDKIEELEQRLAAAEALLEQKDLEIDRLNRQWNVQRDRLAETEKERDKYRHSV